MGRPGNLSRNAATVNSQGREPLEKYALEMESPNGAMVAYRRPVGALRSISPRTRGFRPWL